MQHVSSLRKEMKCVGIDSPSIESYNATELCTANCFSKGCIIIELLDLSDVEEGDYNLVALPLRFTGLDGSPARVVLMITKEVTNGFNH